MLPSRKIIMAAKSKIEVKNSLLIIQLLLRIFFSKIKMVTEFKMGGASVFFFQILV
jgi:hypothetical protein